jgi:DNA-binding PadR family transcriptional regulator
MSAKHAVLGLVIEQPGYGYQLAQRLDERCESWGWESSGVYSALDLLTREGNVRSLRDKGSRASGRAAPRAIYEATPEGMEFFREWMLQPCAPNPVRQELDLKILFSDEESLPRLIDQTWAQEGRCIEELEALTRKARPAREGGAQSWKELAALLQREAEMKLLQVRIEWLQDVRRAMKAVLESRSAG